MWLLSFYVGNTTWLDVSLHLVAGIATACGSRFSSSCSSSTVPHKSSSSSSSSSSSGCNKLNRRRRVTSIASTLRLIAPAGQRQVRCCGAGPRYHACAGLGWHGRRADSRRATVDVTPMAKVAFFNFQPELPRKLHTIAELVLANFHENLCTKSSKYVTKIYSN